jgi:hypothetical protein
MNIKLNNEEKSIVVKFENMRIPTIFKIDKTDRILFIENINFTIRNFVLKNRIIPTDLYNEIIADYEKFIKNSKINDFDVYAFEYFNLCVRIVEILKKSYSTDR